MVDGRLPTSDETAAEQVVVAGRVVANAGYEDLTLGHVSVRGPGGSSMYIKRKGMSLAEVQTSDVVRIDLDDPEALSAPTMHLEAVMHIEAYRARPDVGCVIHGHPLYATALGATDGRLDMVSHDGVLFHDGIGLYDDSPDLITTPEQGRKVAESLGQRRVVLLKNHGVMIVGQDVRWAVLAALTLERAIQLQTIALLLGKINAIPEDEASAMFYDKYQDRFLDEYWDHWTRTLG
ncbi:MAG: class II aldolase/adducin family protein [Acidimicrobiia bacterium]